MKREVVSDVAQSYVSRLYEQDEYPIGLKDIETDVEQAFKDGAEWRITSVWHQPQEAPKPGKFVLGEDETKGHFSIYKLTGQDWTELVEDFRLFRWAYIEDLLPNTEE